MRAHLLGGCQFLIQSRVLPFGFVVPPANGGLNSFGADKGADEFSFVATRAPLHQR